MNRNPITHPNPPQPVVRHRPPEEWQRSIHRSQVVSGLLRYLSAAWLLGAGLGTGYAAPGDIDPGFTDPAVGSTTPYVYGMALQPDGKVLIGGNFLAVAGQTRTRVARLNADGTLDTGFFDSAPTAAVNAFAVRPDRKILLGGDFTRVNGVLGYHYARLHPDGTRDNSLSSPFNSNGSAWCFALPADGQTLIGGTGIEIDAGSSLQGLLRFKANDQVDSFNALVGFLSGAPYVYGIALQPDGKIIICGDFSNVGGQYISKIARLHPDGTLDTSFNAGTISSGSPEVFTVVVQPDGKIVIGGDFTSVNGTPRNNLARLLLRTSLIS